MRHARVLPLFILFLLPACAPRPIAAGPTVKQAAQLLDGRWRVTGCVVNGEPLAPADFNTLRWTFSGHELLWSDGNTFFFALDDSTSPKSIDLRFPENPTEITRGIYTLEPANPQRLKICISKTDARPTAFDSPPGRRLYLYTLQRDPVAAPNGASPPAKQTARVTDK